MQLRNPRRSDPLHWQKRVMDLVVSTTLLVLLSPILLLTALVVRWKLGKPVMFTQDRPGLKGRPFRMLKFRTMVDAFDESGAPLPDEARITPIGEQIRRFSLDELPQLWNVVRGDMSLVGPRPQLMEYFDRYPPEIRRRHDVRPGITGWAQVRGRNDTTWAERFDSDLWYIDNYSLWLDLAILLRTVVVVIGGAGGVDRSSQLEYYGSTFTGQRGAPAKGGD